MSEPGRQDKDDHPDRVIIRDKRRIDPATGQQREPDPDPATEGTGTGSAPTDQQSVAGSDETTMALESALAAVAERTADLQRLQAEYANYRKRIERDRVMVRDMATAEVLVALLPIVDDIDRARMHDDLTGAFKAVADQLDATLQKLGLQTFGEIGDPFDPQQHEAVLHSESPDVTEPTVTTVMRRGYTYADRMVRPALVGVSDPTHSAPAPADNPVADPVASEEA